MRGWIPACLIACLVAVLFAGVLPASGAASAAEQGSAAARIRDAAGAVEVLLPGEAGAWQPAQAGADLPEGARVRTGAGGSARLAFAGEITCELGPETEAAVGGGGEAGEQKISLLAGRVRISTGQPLREGRVTVTMRRAAVLTTGTTLVLEETGERSAVLVIEGDAGFTPSGGRTVLVMAGETVSAGADGAGAVSRFDSAVENARWGGQAPARAEPEGSMPALAAIFAGVLGLFLVGGIGFAVLYYRVVTRLRGR